MEGAYVFFGRLHDYSISLGTDDIMAWLETKNGDFLVKSFYSSLASRRAELSSWCSLEFLGSCKS